MVLATALMTLFALVMPLAGGAQADHTSEFVLNITPEAQTNETGTDHTLVASITEAVTGAADCTEADGCQIDFEIETGPADPGTTPLVPDLGCTILQGTSQCQVSYSSPDDGTNRIRGWVDDDNDDSTSDADATEKASALGVPGGDPEPDDTDVVTKTWATTGEPDRVEATPTVVSNRIGQQRTISCQVFDGHNIAVALANCDAEVLSGPNANNTIGRGSVVGFIGECTTGPAGEACDIKYRSQEVGTDTVNVFADQDGDDNDDGGNNPDPSVIITSTWTSDITSGPCAGLNYGGSRARPGGGKVIAGSPGADTRNGTAGPDIICVFSGNDTVDANGGNDQVYAGSGSDNVVGEGGDDALDGREGRDRLSGGDGTDTIVSGSQNDIVLGGAGNDVMKGQDGTDALRGKGGADTLEGGADADKILAGNGNDTLKGGGGNDDLDGGLGTDTCRGGPGRDQVRRCER
jgi:Ca2+-binding RTX toxin-like protein